MQQIARQLQKIIHHSVEDLGVEENLSGINPLPVYSPLLLIDLSEENNDEEMNGNLPRAIDSNVHAVVPQQQTKQ